MCHLCRIQQEESTAHLSSQAAFGTHSPRKPSGDSAAAQEQLLGCRAHISRCQVSSVHHKAGAAGNPPVFTDSFRHTQAPPAFHASKAVKATLLHPAERQRLAHICCSKVVDACHTSLRRKPCQSHSTCARDGAAKLLMLVMAARAESHLIHYTVHMQRNNVSPNL